MNTTTMPELRRAEYTDLPAIEKLLAESSLPLTGVREALSTFVVARTGDDIVGVAGFEECRDTGLLRSVAVRPEWRSYGVGRALVTRVISDAEARRVRALYLLTTTAEGYFPSFGFEEVAREAVPAAVRETSEFQSACPESAIVMCRRCSGGETENVPGGGVRRVMLESDDRERKEC